ncbi:MAG: GvpL/GvpF family gas vesicle protein [Acidimicrobiales bacterium]|nr:GvpL/GvpF family gas vesicle protein [Acidimicrobiales bacterium]
MSEDTGTWVYAVANPFPLESLTGATGVDDEPVRALSSTDLIAVVGTVGLERFGETALRRNLEDLRWLEACSRTHHRVVEGVARLAPVVPMPLAVVFHDDVGVEGMLAERRSDIVSALGRVKDRVEWGVKVYFDPKAAVHAADEPGGDAGAGSGTAYLRRRKAELSSAEVARNAAAAGAQEVHRALARLAVATHRRQPQDPRLHGESLAMVLNAAYLVDDQRVDEFAAAAVELDERTEGLRVELTGPWPPYSFAIVGDPGG